MGDIYTSGQVAKLCGVTLRTVINWINQGRLHAYKLPGRRGDNRIRGEELQRFMNENGIPWNSRSEALPSKNKKRDTCILVVDDEPPMAKAICRTIRHMGLQTYTAQNGFEAGRLYTQLAPSLMTLDLQMPGFDGFAVLELLGKEKKCPILVISAMDTPQLKKAVELGADDYLAKPFSNENLQEKIRELLGINATENNLVINRTRA